MALGNLRYQPSLASNYKYDAKHEQQIIWGRFPRWKCMFLLMCGMNMVLIYSMIRLQKSADSIDALRVINISSVVSKKGPRVSAVSTGPNVPLVTVGLYYLPSNESNITKPRARKERAYGSRDSFDYPMGAHLLSNVSEYTIPSDRISYQTMPRGLKYFRNVSQYRIPIDRIAYRTMPGELKYFRNASKYRILTDRIAYRPIAREFKYFNEMKGHNHMDARFGKPEHTRLTDAGRAFILRELLAAWSNFTDENQIPYWIAHGTLLGWWWGGSFLPWDSDIDVQMNANFLYVLTRFNKTVVSNRYLIDVNPHFRIRHLQSYNYIDARLIDMHTGYFIDITGMADTGTTLTPEPQKLLLSDKHRHKTFYVDLHPLVRIEFEGIATWRPYHVEKCLITEYGARALVQTAYRGYNYDVVNATWVRNKSSHAVPSRVSGGVRRAPKPVPIRARPAPIRLKPAPIPAKRAPIRAKPARIRAKPNPIKRRVLQVNPKH